MKAELDSDAHAGGPGADLGLGGADLGCMDAGTGGRGDALMRGAGGQRAEAACGAAGKADYECDVLAQVRITFVSPLPPHIHHMKSAYTGWLSRCLYP